MRWLLVLALTGCFGCKRHPAVPDKYIGFDTMRSVVWDLARADQFAIGYLAKDTTRTLRQHTDSLYKIVFQIHHITRNHFYESLDYYQSNPILDKTLMDSVYESGTREKTKLTQVKSAPGQAPHLKKSL